MRALVVSILSLTFLGLCVVFLLWTPLAVGSNSCSEHVPPTCTSKREPMDTCSGVILHKPAMGDRNQSDSVAPWVRDPFLLAKMTLATAEELPLPPYAIAFTTFRGQLYVVNEEDLSRHDGWAYRGRIRYGVNWILRTLQRFGCGVPDTTFVFSVNDAGLMAPLNAVVTPAFAMTTGNFSDGVRNTDWVLVDGEGLEWVTPLLSWDGPPWINRTSVAFWRGSYVSYRINVTNGDPAKNPCGLKGYGPEECPRCSVVQMTAEYPTLIDARFTHVQENCGAGDFQQTFGHLMGVPIAREAHANYKYVINVDGMWFSSRAKFLFALGSTVLLQRSPACEYWVNYFQPYVHYVPFVLDDASSPEYLPRQVEWLQKNDERAYDIAMKGLTEARRVFHPNFITCHIARSLELWYADNLYPLLLGPRSVALPACTPEVAEDCAFSEMCLRHIQPSERTVHDDSAI